jgi:hypothetical protein
MPGMGYRFPDIARPLISYSDGMARAASGLVPLLWLITVDLLARFTHLLDNQICGLPFDHALDRRVFVSRGQTNR